MFPNFLTFPGYLLYYLVISQKNHLDVLKNSRHFHKQKHMLRHVTHLKVVSGITATEISFGYN